MIRNKAITYALILVSVLFCYGLSGCSVIFNALVEQDGDYYLEQSLDFYTDGEYSKAIDSVNKAIEKGIDNTPMDDVYKIIGASYDELGLFEKAVDSYNKALEINPQNYAVWTNLGVLYRQNEDYEKAEEALQKALSINPDYAEALSSLGTMSLLLGESQKAISYFEKAIKKDPSLAVAHGNLALAYAVEGRFDEADKALKQARVMGYGNADEIQKRIDDLK